jgi:hypothetical protein
MSSSPAPSTRKYVRKYKRRDPAHKTRPPVIPCSQRLQAAAAAANAGVILAGPRVARGASSSSSSSSSSSDTTSRKKRKLDISWTKPQNRTHLDKFVVQNCVVRAVACANVGTCGSLTDGRADRRVYPAITINVHNPRLAMTISTIRASTGSKDLPVVKINITGAESYEHALLAIERLRMRFMKFPQRYFTPEEIRRGVHLRRNVCSRYLVNLCCTARLSVPIDMDKFRREHSSDLGGIAEKPKKKKRKAPKRLKTEQDGLAFPAAFWSLPTWLSTNGGDRGFDDAKHMNLAVVFSGSDKPGATASMNLMGMITTQSVEDASRFIPSYMKQFARER